MGLSEFESGVVGGELKTRPKPSASHSFVTPTHGVGGGALQYSTRIQGPVMAAGVAGLVVSSPINGIEAQTFAPLSVSGLTQPLLPGVANPNASFGPSPVGTAILALGDVIALGNSTSFA